MQAVADPRIVAKFDLVNFSLLQQVEALAHARRLREIGAPTSEIIQETTRLFGFNTRSLLTGKGSGYENARVIFADMLKERATAELAHPPIQGDFPPCLSGRKRRWRIVSFEPNTTPEPFSNDQTLFLHRKFVPQRPSAQGLGDQFQGYRRTRRAPSPHQRRYQAFRPICGTCPTCPTLYRASARRSESGGGRWARHAPP